MFAYVNVISQWRARCKLHRVHALYAVMHTLLAMHSDVMAPVFGSHQVRWFIKRVTVGQSWDAITITQSLHLEHSTVHSFVFVNNNRSIIKLTTNQANNALAWFNMLCERSLLFEGQLLVHSILHYLYHYSKNTFLWNCNAFLWDYQVNWFVTQMNQIYWELHLQPNSLLANKM